MAMRRRLLQLQPHLAQQALRGAIPKPRPLPIPDGRFLHSPSPPAVASPSPPAADSPSPLPNLLWRSSGSAGSLLPTSAGAVAAAARTVAARWLSAHGAGSLELFSLQRRKSSGWFPSSSTFLHGASWASWTSSPDDIVLMLIGGNVAVHLLWRVASPSFMGDHFMISLDNFKSGRLHTVLTSAFSHKDLGHLFNNMIGLYFFGSSIVHMFGPAFLLKLYVAGALTGSAFYLAEMAFLAPRHQGFGGWKTPALGASAAVNATILLDIFLYPKKILYLNFFIPVPAALVGAGLIGADLWRMKKGHSDVSGSAHLGGALVAALLWARIRMGWF